MILTEEQIDHLDRAGVVRVLEAARNDVYEYDQKKEAYRRLSSEINQVKQKANQRSSGLTGKALIIAGAVFAIIVGLLTRSITNGFGWGVIFIGVYYFLNRSYLPKKRAEKAKVERDRVLPGLMSELKTVEQELDRLEGTDSINNLTKMLPDEYISFEAIDSLINLLKERRARGLSDAIYLLDSRQHQQRLESMERDRLAAVKEAAEAQKKAARAVEENNRRIQQLEKERARDAEVARLTAANRRTQNRGMMKCPRCQAMISKKARMCPYCHADFANASPGDVFLGKGYKGSMWE